MSSSLKDLAKIGVFLIGVSLIILASIAIHFYIGYLSRTLETSYPARPFTSYCSPNRVIIIEAYRDLEDVKVLDNSSNIICSFGKISRSSEELCNISDYGVYVITYGEFKDIVDCVRPIVHEPKPID